MEEVIMHRGWVPATKADPEPVKMPEETDSCIPVSHYHLADKLLTVSQKVLTTKDLEILLSGKTIKLDCGHRATIGHNLANTVIIDSEGGGKIKTCCHNCGY